MTQVLQKFKCNHNKVLNFDFLKAKVDDINKIIRSLNPRKATGQNDIPVKILKIARNVIDSFITNRDIKENNCSDAKTALVRPLCKNNDRDKIQNYRSVSIFNGLSKVYKRYLLKSSSNHIEKILCNFTTYKKTYSSCHDLIRLVENWKKHLLIAKLHVYGFNIKAFTFLYSYFQRGKQSVKMNYSFFQILLSIVSQGSNLVPVLFNLFINDLFFFIKEAEFANFAYDNTIYVGSKDLRN